jgi:hypothetical protein
MNNTWKNLFSPRRAEQELDREMLDHLDRQTNENIRKGMTPEAARRTARLSLGGVEQVKEECRDERPARLLTDLDSPPSRCSRWPWASARIPRSSAWSTAC